jgi:1-acyl-sn-glycerol-3-phosphate acyltransferase
LFNRHWQHYKADPDGWNWFEYGLFLLPCGFYVALAIRWVRLGFRSPIAQNVEPDPVYQQTFRREVLTPIVKYYFRGDLYQTENLPQKGPLIVAMNHAGMCFPWDFAGLGVLLSQRQDWSVQILAHPIFFDHPWLRWWLPQGWMQALGGVRAERQSFEAALASTSALPESETIAGQPNENTILLYAPEGWRGLAKGWQQRYQLATFDPSFVRLSLRYKVPILPIACIGSEYLHPFTVNVQRLARWLKLPMFPISPLIIAFLLFPSLGVWAVRSRLKYFIQPLWYPLEEEPEAEGNQGNKESDLTNDKPDQEKESQHVSRALTYRISEGLRSRLQETINSLRNSIVASR